MDLKTRQENTNLSREAISQEFYDLSLLAERQKMILNSVLSSHVDLGLVSGILHPQPPSLVADSALIPSIYESFSRPPSRDTQQYMAQVLAKGGRRHRGEKKPIPELMKDFKYFERRKRNNVAAKKSRDARKMREDEVSRRADNLEKENAELRIQVANLRELSSSLRAIIINKAARNIRQLDSFHHPIITPNE